MLERSRIALNRIVCPRLPIRAFLQLAAEVGFAAVELRNDLAGRGLTDEQDPEETRRVLRDLGLQALSINALQKFNLPERLEASRFKLRELLEAASRLGCPAVVLCPNNDPADRREGKRRIEDLQQCLRVLRPLFEDSGTLGYVEPLGFAESSLSSLAAAAQAIRAVEGAAAGGCYRLVWDTFHHHLGPDSPEVLGEGLEAGAVGLVHVSGVEVDPPPGGYRDEQRVLPSAADRMDSRAQVARLLAAGYAGPVSLEPFSPTVQDLPLEALRAALRGSVEYLCGEG